MRRPDNYWALFPFDAYWDKSASAIDQGKLVRGMSPLRHDSMRIRANA
jgi:hypothetical protein